MGSRVTRRVFLTAAGAAAASAALAACGATPTPTPAPTAPPVKVEVTKVVEKAVTQIVEKPVTQVVEKVVTATPAPTVCKMDWNPTQPPAPKVYKPAVQISVPVCADDPKWLGKDDRFNNPMYNRIKDNLGIEFKVHWQATGDACTQKYSTDLAAGTLPDMRNVSVATELADLIDKGAAADITDVWNATASPLVKQKKGYPDSTIWVPVTRKGRIFGIAHTNGPAWNGEMLGVIRKDLLDKTGMPMPQTLDDLTTVAREMLKAKLCKYPILTRSALYTYASSLDPVWGAFGAMPEHWLLAADGSLEYGSLRPGAKDALNVLRGWYKDGLLFPDFYSITNPAATGQLAAGDAAIAFNPWWFGGNYVTWEQANPGWQFATMPIPKGPAGLQGRQGPPLIAHAVVFKKGIETIKVEAAINSLNWAMERHANWEKYQQYGEWRNSHAFAQGYEWEWDEKCELKTGPIANTEGTYLYTAFWAMDFAFQSYSDYQADIFRDMQKWMQQDFTKLNKAQRYLISRPLVRREMELYLAGFDTRNLRMEDKFYGAAGASMKKYWPSLTKLELEYRIGIATGQKPLTAFEEFVATWKKNGGDEVTAEVNKWWAEQKK